MWQLNDFDLWLADYRNKRPTRKHGMWQYSSKGNVAGVSGVVDMNHVYKDYPSIIAKAGLTSVKERDPTESFILTHLNEIVSILVAGIMGWMGKTLWATIQEQKALKKA